MFNADIDIDTPTNFNPNKLFPQFVRASQVKNDLLFPHPCGYYAQSMPKDIMTGLAAIPFKDAEEEEYLKIDFLHLHIYDHFDSREDIDQLLEIEPDWSLLHHPVSQPKLFQVAKHGDVLKIVNPKSIEELADVLALIRPGKRQLLDLYKTQRESVRKILYSKDKSGYSFKKSHAICYSMVIVLQLHLINLGII